MSDRDLLPFMYVVFGIAGTVFLAAVCTVLIWLFLAQVRRGSSLRKPLGQEFVWTLVPALVFVGLTVLGEIPRGWVQFAAGPRDPEIQVRLER